MKYIICRPRSRSYWLSRFLSSDKYSAKHEQSIYYKSIEDMEKDSSVDCVVDTGLALLWDKLPYKSDVLIIDRPIEECEESLKGIGITPDYFFYKVSEAVDKAKKTVLRVFPYSSLSDKSVCEEIYKWATGKNCPDGWWEELSQQILTEDVEKVTKEVQENMENILNMYGSFLIPE